MRPSLEWYRFDELPARLLYEALAFRQGIFVVEQQSPYLDLDGHDQRALHLLARQGGALIGYLRVVPWPAQEKVTIGRVSIAPSHRGQGIARVLMVEAMARAARDYPRYRPALGAQAYLLPFYESLGFAAVSDPYDDCGVPHIDMALKDWSPGRGDDSL